MGRDREYNSTAGVTKKQWMIVIAIVTPIFLVTSFVLPYMRMKNQLVSEISLNDKNKQKVKLYIKTEYHKEETAKSFEKSIGPAIGRRRNEYHEWEVMRGYVIELENEQGEVIAKTEEKLTGRFELFQPGKNTACVCYMPPKAASGHFDPISWFEKGSEPYIVLYQLNDNSINQVYKTMLEGKAFYRYTDKQATLIDHNGKYFCIDYDTGTITDGECIE